MVTWRVYVAGAGLLEYVVGYGTTSVAEDGVLRNRLA